MTIAICSSMAFAKEMLATKRQLELLGHAAYVSDFTEQYVQEVTDEESKNRLGATLTQQHDVISEFWEKIQKSDAILVLNLDRKGIPGYVGGNTLMEIGFAHVLKKKIFLMQPVPNMEYSREEIEKVKPVILQGDLTKIS